MKHTKKNHRKAAKAEKQRRKVLAQELHVLLRKDHPSGYAAAIEDLKIGWLGSQDCGELSPVERQNMYLRACDLQQFLLELPPLPFGFDVWPSS